MKQDFCLLLQINDALFPIGSYTQSYGFETYIQKEKVVDEATATNYLKAQMETSFLHSELLLVKLAHERAASLDLDGLLRLEQLSKAARVPMELRSANFKLGNRFVKAVEAMGLECPFLTEYVTRCKPVGLSHAIAYGVLCGSLHMDLEEALLAYLYAQTSANVTNAVKLVPLSQTVGQRILYGTHKTFAHLLTALEALTENDLFTSTPGLDIRAMEHEVLYSRLYMS